MGGKESSLKTESSKPSEDGNAGVKSQRLKRFFAAVSHDGSNVVTKDNFINYFPKSGRAIAERLFTRIGSSETETTKENCTEILTQILSVATTTAQNSLYIAVFSGISLKNQDVLSLLQSALTLFLLSSGVSSRLSDADNSALNSLAVALTSKGMVTSAASWMDDNCPELFTVMHRCLIGWLRGDERVLSSDHLEDAFTGRLLCSAWWWILQSSLSGVFMTKRSKSTQCLEGAAEDLDSLWELLYSSTDHGLSTNRLQHHVFGYRGPTLMLLSCDDGSVYAVAVDTEWREGTKSWGGSECCVMRLTPDFKKLEEGHDMILFNDRSRNIPRGLSVGRNPKRQTLCFKEGMELVQHNHKTSSVRTLEIWGCGDSGTRTAQAKLKKMELKDAERAAKVKLPGQWDENPDKMILEMGGVTVNHAEQYARD